MLQLTEEQVIKKIALSGHTIAYYPKVETEQEFAELYTNNLGSVFHLGEIHGRLITARWDDLAEIDKGILWFDILADVELVQKRRKYD